MLHRFRFDFETARVEGVWHTATAIAHCTAHRFSWMSACSTHVNQLQCIHCWPLHATCAHPLSHLTHVPWPRNGTPGKMMLPIVPRPPGGTSHPLIINISYKHSSHTSYYDSRPYKSQFSQGSKSSVICRRAIRRCFKPSITKNIN